MAKSNTHKIKLLPKTEIKFNVNMHGFKKDSVLIFGRLSIQNQILIRRRLSDNDNSVEIVKGKSNPKQEKPKDGKGASKQGDN